MDFQPGSLVKVRNREWIVQPSDDEEVMLIKPLGGSEDEITGIFLPLNNPDDKIESTDFPKPTVDQLGDFATAKLLYNAARLSFRNGAGPFRSMAKLSFRPRSYQMVPLIMALQQEVIRLMIADDVGIGKTPESLLIAKELLERREIKRFAVICPPHLCDQWQREIKDKFDIDAVIIRSNSQARLDREIQGDVSVFQYFPYQVISVDYIKSDTRRNVFIKECPEFCIVDEVHTCAKPAGTNKGQHLRYSLIYDLAQKPNQHLVLLTATPHSGKAEEFQSLLGLLKPKFEKITLGDAKQEERKEIAGHFVQRKRADVVKWMDEETLFPMRDSAEVGYKLSAEYALFYNELLDFARGLTVGTQKESKIKQRMRYWTALALMRGCMSSPQAGLEMLERRINKQNLELEEEVDLTENPVLDNDEAFDADNTPSQVMDKAEWESDEIRSIKKLQKLLEQAQGVKLDYKAKDALTIVSDWLNESPYHFNAVIFCRYIATAKYLGEVLGTVLKRKFGKDLDVQVITSEDPDEVRKQRIDDMKPSPKRVLIATDCLSEGINLQESFNAVLHYDLPWNPNRLEQREGRVDRFGQSSPSIKTYLLYGKDNPIDGVVLKVLIHKVKEIKRDLKISMPFPDDSQSIMDAVLQSVLLNPKKIQENLQLGLFDGSDEIKKAELQFTKKLDDAAKREKASRDLFAQHAIKAKDIEDDLKAVDAAIGNPDTVKNFVKEAMAYLGVQIDPYKEGFRLYFNNIPEVLKTALVLDIKKQYIQVTFKSPTPEAYIYLGRNHAFVEQLSQYIMAAALNPEPNFKIARAAVIKTKAVDQQTTLLLFRVRNVIGEKGGATQLVAEEMLLWGYEGMAEEKQFLGLDQAKKLLEIASSTDMLTEPRKQATLKEELDALDDIKADFDRVALQRAEVLVTAHEKFRKLVGGVKYQPVLPVLPMDIMGIYVLIPDKK
ncbi:DEAD/DEAH box helicase [Aquiflexum gelatinilyticum]|uniref:DEAD/DEAH box helicase n=1 Tax=Aquiflexum gelatinilyticum TaxID=2961943 RepID=UPI002169B4BE|nr:DEAD/DEAH box helicase [Aquiflexum gelatinilyticum]MCS4432863.1 DEAD/DEAH box helicase [Aquiflexum gelatinilyticum]